MPDAADFKQRLEALTIDRSQRPKSSRASGRLFLWGVALGVLGFGAFAGYRYYQTAGRNIAAAFAEPVIQVRLLKVPSPRAAAAEIALVATGKIVSDRRVNVATKVSGQIVDLHVEQGDHVLQGQVLARIEDVAYRAYRDEVAANVARFRHELARATAEAVRARNEIAQAEAEAAFQERNFRRLERLFAVGQASEQEFLDAKNRHEAADAALRVAQAAAASAEAAVSVAESQTAAGEASLRQAQKRLDDCEIVAPISGVVLERNAEIGDFLAAEGGRGMQANAQLVSIADMEKLRVEIDVSERDIGRLFPGQRARITPDANRAKTFSGYILWIDPIGDYAKATVQVKVRIEEPTPDLRIEGSAKVEFERPISSQPSSRPAIWLPKSAVVMSPGSADGTVYTVTREGRAAATPVRLGTRGDADVEVLEGVFGGMEIIADGLDKVKDGTRLELKRD
jgi:HlyD family secretion protein